MELRPYQKEAHQAILQDWENGIRKTLLVLPTGTGKTIVFSKVIESRVIKGDRVLILAHRGELLDQAADKLYKATGLRSAVEKGKESCRGTLFRVVVGSVQTMMREERLLEFPPDFFDTIIVDEAHHILSDSYQRIMDHFHTANVLGVTATPDRGDKKNLGKFFDNVAYEYTLPEAIRSGYLCPIKVQTIPLELDLTGVGVKAGDFNINAEWVETALDPYLKQIADEIKRICVGRKTVVFLPLIETSRKMVTIMNANGLRAVQVNGKSKDRAELLKAFEDGEYDVMCNSMLLTEGWDCPSVDCIVVLRPTKVRSLYAQMVGRGTRLHPGKEDLLLLDFLWHTDRHELCHPANLICESEEIARKMTENIADADEPVDLEAAEETAKEDVIAQREEALQRELEEAKRRTRKLVDPLQYEFSIDAEDLINYEPVMMWEMLPPSEKQLQTLEKFGIFPDDVTTAGFASKLIDRLIKRSKAGLATPKQIRLLEKKGFKKVGSWQFSDANRMIGRISANNWRIPASVIPELYDPRRN